MFNIFSSLFHNIYCQMFNAKAVQQMTISLVEMVICRQNRIMIDPDTMVASGSMKKEVIIDDRKICVQNRSSIIANNRADGVVTIVINSVPNVTSWVPIVRVIHPWRIIIQDDDQKLKTLIIKQIPVRKLNYKKYFVFFFFSFSNQFQWNVVLSCVYHL